MQHTQTLKGVPILALAVVLAACGQAAADQPSANPQPTDRPAPVEPSERPSAEPSERPRHEPVAPAPSQPTAPPTEAPSAPPAVDPEPVVVEHGVHFVARVIRDGVAVRNLPDLDSALVDATNDGEGSIVEEIRLRIGDEVRVLVGPVFADGYSWYEVVAGGRGPAYSFRGWVAGEFIEHLHDAPEFNSVAWVDGQGFSASSSGHVPEFAPLVVAHGVTPLPGDASCTFELYLIGTDGQRIVLVPTQTVTDARIGQVAAGNLAELSMDAGGSIEIGANTDCSFAAAVNIPQG
jgi:hypothetical protein